MSTAPRLLATSDLHVTYQQNREFVDAIRPHSPDDWLIVAGDVAEKFDDVEWALGVLRGRFAKVVWSPGNHELWTTKDDPAQARGEVRYKQLVELCRSIDVLTPDDEFAVFEGAGGPVAVAPLFTLYDYTFRPAGTTDKASALAVAQEAALKLKETCGLHAEAFSGAEVLHGPVALVARRYPVLMFTVMDETAPGLRELADSLRAMRAIVLEAGIPPREFAVFVDRQPGNVCPGGWEAK